jgi:hypothetical protein
MWSSGGSSTIYVRHNKRTRVADHDRRRGNLDAMMNHLYICMISSLSSFGSPNFLSNTLTISFSGSLSTG